MRRLLIVAVPMFVFAALGLVLLTPSTQAGAEKPVKVDANCPKEKNGKFTISVDPLIVTVAPGQGVTWSLDTDNKGNDYIEVSAKNPADWLYEDSTVKGQKTVVMTNMKDGSAGKEYEYNITVFCGDGEPVVLDPRIKVE